MIRTPNTSNTRTPMRQGNIIEPFILLGVFLELLFGVCILLQIQTTESFVGSGVIVQLVKPDPAVLYQLWYLILGQLSPSNIVVTIAGWGSELAYFACIIGHKHFNYAIGRHNKAVAIICDVVAVAIVIFNWISDYVYGQAVIAGVPGQISFAVIVSFIVASFGLAGIHFIKIGCGLEKA